MNPERLLHKIQQVPYKLNGSDWDGLDCWGLCELWFKEKRGIILKERSKRESSPAGFYRGFKEVRDNWVHVTTPKNDDLAVMRSMYNGVVFIAGHVGVVYEHGVLHCDQSIGCVWQQLSSKQIKTRITGFYRHRDLI